MPQLTFKQRPAVLLQFLPFIDRHAFGIGPERRFGCKFDRGGKTGQLTVALLGVGVRLGGEKLTQSASSFQLRTVKAN